MFEFFRTYVQVMFLWEKQSKLLWSDDCWASVVFPAVNQLVQLEGRASVHVRKVEGPESNPVRLGKITWGTDASRTWSVESGEFIDLEIYVPPKSELIKKVAFPLVYVHLLPEVECEGSTSRYGQLLHLAVRKSLWKKHRSRVEAVVAELADNPKVVAAYEAERRVSSLNEFEDLITEDFSYRGMLMDEMPDVSKMRKQWRLVGIREA